MRVWIIMFYFYFILVSCSSTEQREPPSWSKLLSVATTAALKLDSDATLWEVQAFVASNPPRNVRNLEISFFFLASDKDLIKVTLMNTMSELASDVTWQGSRPSVTEQEILARQRGMTTVQLSPFEAIDRTISNGRAFTEKQQALLRPQMNLLLGENIPDHYKSSQAVWSISYPTATETLSMWVDAQSGKVLGEVIDP